MFIYNFLIRVYGLIIKTAGLRQLKAKQWADGRKNWRGILTGKIKKLDAARLIWVHCASYGEFEQGRPLMEALKKKYPAYKLLLTFFSPSGFEPFKDWPGADIVCYLPLDTPENARSFLEIVKPTTVIFIKYEFWVNLLFEIQKKKIPAFLVSAVFKPHHPFFKWYGGIFKRSLFAFEKLFLQDENSAALLKSAGIVHFEVCGDTRFDRVLEIKSSFKLIPFIGKFCGDHKILVAGSTWPGDEELLVATFLSLSDPNLKMIIAPHNVDAKNILTLVQLLEKNELSYTKFSDQDQDIFPQVLILDTIGLLSKIYYYAHITYIGGGFNSGIHNCLEPAVYLKPVMFFGDDFDKFNEAVDLVNLKAAKNVMDATELEVACLHYLNNWTALEDLEKNLKVYFEKKSGVTQKVLDAIAFS